MSKVIFKLNQKGIGAILQSRGVNDACYGYAQKMADEANKGGVDGASAFPDESGSVGYVADKFYPGKTRVNAGVRPASAHAYYSNLAHGTLEEVIKPYRTDD